MNNYLNYDSAHIINLYDKGNKKQKYKFYVYTVLLFNQNSIEYLQPW